MSVTDEVHDAAADAATVAELRNRFAAQRTAFRRTGAPTVAERQRHLGALAGMVLGNRARIQEAMAADFAVHPEQLTYLTEVLAVAGQAQYVIERLPEWTRPDSRAVDPALYGTASAEIRYEPKGVLGIISPWNFPFLLSLGPLVDMLGAGNRVVVKPSEHTPACAELLRELVAQTFDPDHVSVVCGGVDLARFFPTLPWDHLLYTGSTAIGREVTVSAASNLVPVTLELGGKNPAVVLDDAVNERTVAQIVGNKLVKSGQVCIAPDYCLVPRDRVGEFIDLAKRHLAATPGYANSADCTGIVSERHLDRLTGLLDEAVARGCEVVQLEGSAGVNRGTRQLPLSIVVDPPEDIALMREEIFGPILPVKPYDSVADAIAWVNAGDRPLGLYVFSSSEQVAEHVLDSTVSGGACVNTCAVQGVLPALGFGGSGASGSGRHRGIEGFREFSTARGVVRRGAGDLIDAFFPPYSGLAQTVVTAAFDQIDGQDG